MKRFIAGLLTALLVPPFLSAPASCSLDSGCDMYQTMPDTLAWFLIACSGAIFVGGCYMAGTAFFKEGK